MYIILVKCNDHLIYVTKIIWSVIDTAKDQHKSKQEVHVYLYSEIFPGTNVLVHSETKYNRDEIINNRFLSTDGMFTPFKIIVTVGCIFKNQNRSKMPVRSFACADLEGVCVCLNSVPAWKIQISINIVNLHSNITENTIIGTDPIGN